MSAIQIAQHAPFQSEKDFALFYLKENKIKPLVNSLCSYLQFFIVE
jgi:hypothetical protein